MSKKYRLRPKNEGVEKRRRATSNFKYTPIDLDTEKPYTNSVGGLNFKMKKDNTNYPRKLDRAFQLSQGLDSENIKEEYNTAQVIARTKKQATVLELKQIDIVEHNVEQQSLVAFSNGLVRVMILKYQGTFVGKINDELIGWRFKVGKNTIIISSKGDAKDIDEMVLFTYLGRFNITEGMFWDYNLKSKKVVVLTENNFVRGQISGGNKGVQSRLHWQGKIKYLSPLRNTYNFIGDTWERKTKTFSEIDKEWEILSNHFNKDKKVAKKLFKNSRIGFMQETTTVTDSSEAKFIVPNVPAEALVRRKRRKSPRKSSKLGTRRRMKSTGKYSRSRAKMDIEKINKNKRPSGPKGDPMGPPDVD